MSRILVIGGHGQIARLLSPLLVADGHQVTALIRNPDHADAVATDGATPSTFNIEHQDRDAIVRQLAGHDAVVWSAGAGGGNPGRTYAVDRDAAIRSMDAAAHAGVRRYVMVSYISSGRDHHLSPDDPFFAYAEAKAAADEHLRGSALDWTILGPGRLTSDAPSGRIAPVATRNSGPTARGNVARVIAAVLPDPATYGLTLDFVDGEVPIAQAIRNR